MRKAGGEVLPKVTLGGDRGTRTPDLSVANAALSQLSYIPRQLIIAKGRFLW